MMSIFLSYSRNDKDFADILYRLVESRGYDTWIDRRNIEAGSRWDQSIQSAIDEKSHLIVILSSTSAASDNVADEWSYALEQGKRVIPLYYKECNVPMRLRRLQRIDFFGRDVTDAMAELIAELGEPDKRPTDRIELARRDGYITIELVDIIRIGIAYSDYPLLDAFIRTVWYCLLWRNIPPGSTNDAFYEYGKRWVFKNRETGTMYQLPDNPRQSVLHEMGIEPGTALQIVLKD
jgi:hypothetical protein